MIKECDKVKEMYQRYKKRYGTQAGDEELKIDRSRRTCNTLLKTNQNKVRRPTNKS